MNKKKGKQLKEHAYKLWPDAKGRISAITGKPYTTFKNFYRAVKKAYVPDSRSM